MSFWDSWTTPRTSGPNKGRTFLGADTWNYGGLEVKTPNKALADGDISQQTYNAHMNSLNTNRGGGGKKGTTSSNTNDDATTATNDGNIFDLSTINTGLADYGTQVGGSDMYSYIDNPNTDINESLAGTIGGDIGGYVDTLSGLDLSGYANADEITAALAAATGLQDTMSGYETDLADATTATQNAIDNYTKGLMGSTYGIGDYGIQDIDAVDDLSKDLYMSNLDYQFDPNIDQTIASGLGLDTNYNTLYGTATDTLGNVSSAYDTAVSDLNTNIGNLNLGGIASSAGNIGYGSTAGVANELAQAIASGEEFANASGLSNSQLNALMQDNNFMGQVKKAQDNIAAAQAAQAAEQSRVSNYMSGQRSDANNLLSQIGSSGYYSKAGLDALQNAINQGKAGYADFSSPMGFDSSGLDSLYGNAQTTLDELIARRSSNLDRIQGNITDTYSGFDDINLWEEDRYNQMLSGLGDSDYNLGYYTGGRVGDIYNTLDDYRGNVQGKLNELQDYRGGIETNTQTLLDNLLASNYNRQTNEQFQGELDPLISEITKYGATQASDEQAAIEKELARRRGLIEADEANVAARIAASNADLGNYQFDDYTLIDPFQNQMNPYLFSDDEEEEQNMANNLFSSNVIRV